MTGIIAYNYAQKDAKVRTYHALSPEFNENRGEMRSLAIVFGQTIIWNWIFSDIAAGFKEGRECQS